MVECTQDDAFAVTVGKIPKGGPARKARASARDTLACAVSCTPMSGHVDEVKGGIVISLAGAFGIAEDENASSSFVMMGRKVSRGLSIIHDAPPGATPLEH